MSVCNIVPHQDQAPPSHRKDHWYFGKQHHSLPKVYVQCDERIATLVK